MLLKERGRRERASNGHVHVRKSSLNVTKCEGIGSEMLWLYVCCLYLSAVLGWAGLGVVKTLSAPNPSLLASVPGSIPCHDCARTCSCHCHTSGIMSLNFHITLLMCNTFLRQFNAINFGRPEKVGYCQTAQAALAMLSRKFKLLSTPDPDLRVHQAACIGCA